MSNKIRKKYDKKKLPLLNLLVPYSVQDMVSPESDQLFESLLHVIVKCFNTVYFVDENHLTDQSSLKPVESVNQN